MPDFASGTTALVLVAVGATNLYLNQDPSAFVVSHHGAQRRIQARAQESSHSFVSQPFAAMQDALGSKCLVAYGAGFGALVAAVHSVRGHRRGGPRRVARKAAEIDVATKSEGKVLPYFKSLPRTLISKNVLDTLLATVPKEQWEDPPEDSYLYTLKCYAETYGEGKATKMGWWDFFYIKVTEPSVSEAAFPLAFQEQERIDREKARTGQMELFIPGNGILGLGQNLWSTGAKIQWRGKEWFAGDQCQTPVTSGAFATQWLDNLAFYRKGLKPWQRGLEIGMAHGYFIIGPFVSLGPLRNTPEAATVGLIAGVALIGIVSVGGLLFGTTMKPTLFDKKGDVPASGFTEMINWHALGGVGGAGFAHALITIFGS